VTEADLAPGENTEPLVELAPAELADRGAYLATLTFRPFDGSDVQRIAKLAATEDYARAAAYEAMHAALGQVQTMAPDTPAVRTFINAASHMHDLRQALGALESAQASTDTNVVGKLRLYAVVAHGRTYGSHARPDLAKFIVLSPGDAATTARLKVVRNKHGAHSENSMAVTTPVLDLQREVDGSITIKQVSGITVEAPMPASFVSEFTSMLHRLIEQLTAALQPLKNAIRVELTSKQLRAVFDNPQPLQFVVTPVAEWEPDGRRPAYPSSRFSPVHLDSGDDSSFNASITR